MPRLRYRALTRAGAREAGFVEAASAEAATSALRNQGLIVLDVSERRETSVFFGRVRHAELAEFTRALAALLPAGLPLVRAISVARDIAPPSLESRLSAIATRVESGSSFADALAEHPDVFPASYVGLVRAGERSGALAESIARLADTIESDVQFRARLLTAAIYPVLLLVVGGAALAVLLLVVLPRFAALFALAGNNLPRSTALVLSFSSALREHALVVGLVASAMAALGLWLFAATDAAAWRARVLLAIPATNQLYREVLAARAARLLSMLLAGGAPLIAALDDAARSLDVPQARDELLRIRARVREGTRMIDAVQEDSLFPPLFARLVAVGEESSQLATFLGRAADLFEERSRRATARFLAVAEPALVVVFGLIVGAIALALVQAIYGINVTPLRALR